MVVVTVGTLGWKGQSEYGSLTTKPIIIRAEDGEAIWKPGYVPHMHRDGEGGWVVNPADSRMAQPCLAERPALVDENGQEFWKTGTPTFGLFVWLPAKHEELEAKKAARFGQSVRKVKEMIRMPEIL